MPGPISLFMIWVLCRKECCKRIVKTKKKRLQNLSPVRLIAGGYCLVILLGTLLLALPFATAGGNTTPISDCLFTAVSASCVTGLVRFDTATHWTLFGQLVILTLIQIGGVGFMTIAMVIMTFTRRKIGLNQRSIMQNSVSAPQIGGIIRMSRFILSGTLLIEGIGALLLSFYFVPRLGKGRGFYYAIFHSISAFCNAGFDLMGSRTGPFSSLTGLKGSVYVNVVLMLLIFMGGLGFFVWQDVLDKKMRYQKFALQSKMVLSVSIGLVLIGALGIFFFEYRQEAFAGMNRTEQITASFFQSVSARTAGFNTIDLSRMTESSKLLMIMLMLIGGSTGSTAGGMKTTTFWILCISIAGTLRHKKNVEAFGRRMEEGITRTASCIFMLYLLITTISAAVVAAIEKVPVITALFETASAMATVGFSFGLTPQVGMVTKSLLMLLMFCGRAGSITILMLFASDKGAVNSRLALEKVQVG